MGFESNRYYRLLRKSGIEGGTGGHLDDGNLFLFFVLVDLKVFWEDELSTQT